MTVEGAHVWFKAKKNSCLYYSQVRAGKLIFLLQHTGKTKSSCYNNGFFCKKKQIILGGPKYCASCNRKDELFGIFYNISNIKNT